jgi:L-asparagine oxygenase
MIGGDDMKEKANLDESGKRSGGSIELPTDCIYELNDDEQTAISNLAKTLPSPDVRSLDDERFLMQVKLLSEEIPRPIRAWLTEFAAKSNDYGAALVRNLPIASVPNTPPTKAQALDKILSTTEKALLLLTRQLGEPRGYLDEMAGALIQPVFPIRGHEYRQENSGSEDFLEIHTEDGFLTDRCDFLVLACLRPDHEHKARTGTASVKHAIKMVPSRVIEWLYKPRYVISVPSSFGADQKAEQLWSEPMPVLSGDYLSPDMCVDLDAMKGTDANAQIALDQFAHALRAVLVSTALIERDVLIIDNYVAAHARSSFRPRYDGYDRWLQRIKVTANPRSSRASRRPGSRVVGPIALDLA